MFWLHFVTDIMGRALVRLTDGSWRWMLLLWSLDEWRKTMVITWLKVKMKFTTFGTNRKPTCDFPLMDTTNLHPILHRFQDIAENC